MGPQTRMEARYCVQATRKACRNDGQARKRFRDRAGSATSSPCWQRRCRVLPGPTHMHQNRRCGSNSTRNITSSSNRNCCRSNSSNSNAGNRKMQFQRPLQPTPRILVQMRRQQSRRQCRPWLHVWESYRWTGEQSLRKRRSPAAKRR